MCVQRTRAARASDFSLPVKCWRGRRGGQRNADPKRQGAIERRPIEHPRCDAVALTQPWRVVRVCDDCASSSTARERQRIGERLAQSPLLAGSHPQSSEADM